MATKKSRFLLIAIVLLAVLAIGFGVQRRASRKVIEAIPDKQANVVELNRTDLVSSEQGVIQTSVPVSGDLRALHKTALLAEVEGRVEAVDVRVGERVSAGQTLARLNLHDFDSRLQEAKANAAAARAEFDLAQRNLRRNQELIAKKFISANSLDSSQASFASSQETLKARQAQLALAAQAKNKALIRSSMNGIIGERAIEPGQFVNVGARLFSVVDLRELEFVAQVTTQDIAQIEVGQHVVLSVQGQDAHLDGNVARIAPTTDANSGMIPVFIRVTNPSEHFKEGMVAHGFIQHQAGDAGLVLPLAGIRYDNQQAYVMVLRNQHLQRQNVVLGAQDKMRGFVAIQQGLQVGEQVLRADLNPPPANATIKIFAPAT